MIQYARGVLEQMWVRPTGGRRVTSPAQGPGSTHEWAHARPETKMEIQELEWTGKKIKDRKAEKKDLSQEWEFHMSHIQKPNV